jgi:hypothetical protein
MATGETDSILIVNKSSNRSSNSLGISFYHQVATVVCCQTASETEVLYWKEQLTDVCMEKNITVVL